MAKIDQIREKIKEAENAKTQPPAAPQATQDPETVITEGPVPTVKGEISPVADQSNRGDELAARMAMNPPKSHNQMAQEAKTFQEKLAKGPTFVNDEGEVEYVDPDELEIEQKVEEFPKEDCLNCRNQGRDNKLDDKGFCKRCGFKLNRVRNIALEPARKPLPVSTQPVV